MTNTGLTAKEKEFMASIKTGRPANEIFSEIATMMSKCHDDDISETESRRLAKNFIGFCQKIIDIQIRLEVEKEKAK